MTTLRKPSWHPIVQHNLLIYPNFGIDFFQSLRFLNSEYSENVTLDRLFSSRLNIVRLPTANVPPRIVYHYYSVGIHIATTICGISVCLVDSTHTEQFRTPMTMYGSYFYFARNAIPSTRNFIRRHQSKSLFYDMIEKTYTRESISSRCVSRVVVVVVVFFTLTA